MRQTPLGVPLGKNSRSASWEKTGICRCLHQAFLQCHLPDAKERWQAARFRKCSTKVLLKILNYNRSCLLQPCTLLIHSFEVIYINVRMWWCYGLLSKIIELNWLRNFKFTDYHIVVSRSTSQSGCQKIKVVRSLRYSGYLTNTWQTHHLLVK